MIFGEDWLVGIGGLKCFCVFLVGRKFDWEKRSRDCVFFDCRLLLFFNCEGREYRLGCDEVVFGSGWVIRFFCLGKGIGWGSLFRFRGGVDDIAWGVLFIRRVFRGWEVGSLFCCWGGGGNFLGCSRGLNVCWEECVFCFWLELCFGIVRRLLDLVRGWYNFWIGLGGGKESLLMLFGWRGFLFINILLWGKGFVDFLLILIFVGSKGIAVLVLFDVFIFCFIGRFLFGLRRFNLSKIRKFYLIFILDLFYWFLFL